eukprot:3119819-Pleurochrysis_carterae.AAC.1
MQCGGGGGGVRHGYGYRKTGRQERGGEFFAQAKEWRNSGGTSEGKKNETCHEGRKETNFLDLLEGERV